MKPQRIGSTGEGHSRTFSLSSTERVWTNSEYSQTFCLLGSTNTSKTVGIILRWWRRCTLYIKPTNEVYAQHILATKHQQSPETLDEYLQVLKTLSKDCNYQNVSSIKYREESVRDEFISGLTSGLIHQRLLENNTLDLKTMFDLARSLESAARTSETYMAHSHLSMLPYYQQTKLYQTVTWLSTQHLVFKEGRSASSVATKDILAPSALHAMPRVPSAERRAISRKFAEVVPHPSLKGGRQLLCGDQHLLPSLLRCPSHLLSRRPRWA